KMIVNVAEFATAIGKPIESIMGEFEHLLSGRIRAQNSDILAALGLGPKDLELGKITLQSVIKGMQELTARAGDMGQSFQSTKEKVKDALLDAFANGFNRARGDAEKGMEGILKAFTDPRLLEVIGKVGEAVAKAFEKLPAIFERIAAVAKALGIQGDLQAIGKLLGGAGKGPDEVAGERSAAILKAFGDNAKDASKGVDVMNASVKGLKNTIISPELEAFQKQLGALVMTGTDVDRNMRVLEAAIKIVDSRLGDGAGRRAFNAELTAMAANAAKVGRVLREDLRPAIESINKPGALGDLLSKSFNVSPDLNAGGWAGGVGI